MKGFQVIGVAFLVLAVTVGTVAAQGDDVGTLVFPTSTKSPEAQARFLRGAAILHSFGWKQAITEFQAAQKLDPDFAMAYWGESLCYNHPLIGDRDLDSPRAVLKRLGATPRERLAKAPTDREKGFLQAVELLWAEADIAERKIGYMESMRSLYEKYSKDDEVASHYALATIAAVRPTGDTTSRMYVEAGAIALEVFGRNPSHPGGAHYTIHAFDDPVHAPLALPAAHRFAEIAEAVSHARHMPSHIFIQRGMWERVSISNQSAYEAAINLWEPGDTMGGALHALEWGQYGDLQRGDYAKAKTWMERLEELNEKRGSQARGVSAVPLVKARYVLETETWDVKPVTEKSSAHELLATGISAYHTGDKATLEKAAGQIRVVADKQAADMSLYNRVAKPTRVAQHEVEALDALAKGDKMGAVEHLKKGVELAESMGRPNGPATPLKPVHEIAGEVFLEIGQPEEAALFYQESLLRTPNRPLSVRGLARAHAAMGNRSLASEQYRKLQNIWSGYSVPGLNEVLDYLTSTDAEGQ